MSPRPLPLCFHLLVRRSTPCVDLGSHAPAMKRSDGTWDDTGHTAHWSTQRTIFFSSFTRRCVLTPRPPDAETLTLQPSKPFWRQGELPQPRPQAVNSSYCHVAVCLSWNMSWNMEHGTCLASIVSGRNKLHSQHPSLKACDACSVSPSLLLGAFASCFDSPRMSDLILSWRHLSGLLLLLLIYFYHCCWVFFFIYCF